MEQEESMKEKPCKRFWEGPVGIAIAPRHLGSGKYFWTFSLVRSFKRKGSDKWEYVQHFGQKHAEALGRVMGKAFQFMEQNDAAQFAGEWEAARGAAPPLLVDAQFPPLVVAASR
jgi:hypothetical protein